MAKSTHNGMRHKRKAFIGKIVCIWVALILLVSAAVIYSDCVSRTQTDESYSIIEDEATALAEFGGGLWSEDVIVAVIIAVLAVVALTLLILTISQNRNTASDGQNKKHRELKAHRIDVGAVVGNQDVSEFSDGQLEEAEEKVTLDRTVKVLLVEDNQINMDVAKYMLEEAGIVVHQAKDGQEAVDMFATLSKEEIDVILMDVMMPVMDGIEATKVIRSMEKENSKTIPIIALTASQNEEDIQRTKDAGMNEYMSKPFDIGITLSTIHKYIK